MGPWDKAAVKPLESPINNVCSVIVTGPFRMPEFVKAARARHCDTIEPERTRNPRQAQRQNGAQIPPFRWRSKTFLMARIYPFRAWRYNPSAVRLEDVVTQPYDKISPSMQQAYYQRSPFNLVRIILGLPELFDAERGENVYTRAARDFCAWREQGVLIQENEPCIFAYAQRFKVPGSEIVKERRGFIALGKLHEYAEQVVFRHEQTLSKPKSDRLNLLKATRAHFGQIFMLYSDPAGSVEKILYEGNGAADAEVSDEYGVLHRLWRVNSQRPSGC